MSSRTTGCRYSHARIGPLAGFDSSVAGLNVQLEVALNEHVASRRYVSIEEEDFELWSPNSNLEVFLPGLPLESYRLQMTPNSHYRRYDGSWGRFDYTRCPQYLLSAPPYAPYIRRAELVNSSDPRYVLYGPLMDFWDGKNGGRFGRVTAKAFQRLNAAVTHFRDQIKSSLRRSSLPKAARDCVPEEPAASLAQSLQCDQAWDSALDEFTQVQWHLRRMEAWISWVSQKQPKATDRSTFPLADDSFMGAWVNGGSAECIRELRLARIPCFVVARVTRDDIPSLANGKEIPRLSFMEGTVTERFLDKDNPYLQMVRREVLGFQPRRFTEAVLFGAPPPYDEEKVRRASSHYVRPGPSFATKFPKFNKNNAVLVNEPSPSLAPVDASPIQQDPLPSRDVRPSHSFVTKFPKFNKIRPNEPSLSLAPVDPSPIQQDPLPSHSQPRIIELPPGGMEEAMRLADDADDTSDVDEWDPEGELPHSPENVELQPVLPTPRQVYEDRVDWVEPPPIQTRKKSLVRKSLMQFRVGKTADGKPAMFQGKGGHGKQFYDRANARVVSIPNYTPPPGIVEPELYGLPPPPMYAFERRANSGWKPVRPTNWLYYQIDMVRGQKVGQKPPIPRHDQLQARESPPALSPAPPPHPSRIGASSLFLASSAEQPVAEMASEDRAAQQQQQPPALRRVEDLVVQKTQSRAGRAHQQQARESPPALSPAPPLHPSRIGASSVFLASSSRVTAEQPVAEITSEDIGRVHGLSKRPVSPPNFGDLGDIGRDYLWSRHSSQFTRSSLSTRRSPTRYRSPQRRSRSRSPPRPSSSGRRDTSRYAYRRDCSRSRHSSQFPRSSVSPRRSRTPSRSPRRRSRSRSPPRPSSSDPQSRYQCGHESLADSRAQQNPQVGDDKDNLCRKSYDGHDCVMETESIPHAIGTVSSADVGDGQVADSTTRRRDPPQTSDRPSRSASPLANFPPPQRPGATTPAPTVAPGAFSAEQLPEWNSMLTRQTDCLRAKMELKAVMNDIVQSAAEVSLLDRIGGFSLEEGLLPRMPEPPTSLGSPALETRRPSFQERLGAGQRRSLSPSDVAREDGPQRKKAKHHLVQQTENGKGQEGRKRKTRRGKPNAHNLARAYARKVAKDNIFSERRLTGPITTAAAGSSSINASHQTTSTTAAGFSVANACQARAQMSDDEVSLGEDYGE